LAGAIVKLSGDTPPFIVLRLLQAPRQFSKLFGLLDDFRVSLLELMSPNEYLVFEIVGEHT
jgi:hypothetical protein